MIGNLNVALPEAHLWPAKSILLQSLSSVLSAALFTNKPFLSLSLTPPPALEP